MADVAVRIALAADAGEIGRIQVLTWQIAYSSILPQAVLDNLSAELAARTWQDAITTPPSPRHHVLVATDGAHTVGFAAVGPNSDETGPDDGEIGVLLVEPRWGRRGHGSRLLAAATEFLREDGLTHASVWLPQDDTVSCAFFESTGWSPDGLARTLDTGAGPLREIRLHTDLDVEPEDGPLGAAGLAD